MFGRRFAVVFVFAILLACGKAEPPAKETRYALTATIVARDPSQNAVTMDNKAVPGVMDAMRMDYELRGAKVSSLPPNGTPVTATLHEQGGNYWVTDIKPVVK